MIVIGPELPPSIGPRQSSGGCLAFGVGTAGESCDGYPIELEVYMKSETSRPVSADKPESFVAFLFDADHEHFSRSGNYNYGVPCEEEFLRALAAEDSKRACRARIRRGDVLARELASKLTRLVMVPDTARTRLSAPAKSMHFGTDYRALATIIGDFTNSLTGRWGSVDLTELPHRLGNTNVYCLSAFPMSLPLVKRINLHLKKYPPYIGAVELDPGNPIHIRLCSNLLDCIYFTAGKIHVSRWETGDDVYNFGIDPSNHFEVIELSHNDYQRTAPPFPNAGRPSERGAISATRFNEVTKPSHFEQVAEQLGSLPFNRENKFGVDLKIVLPDDEQLEIPAKKLLEYALNPEHVVGRHKARLFRDLLGIDRSSWRYLAYQLVDGLTNAQLEHPRVTEHGVQYSALVQVIGLNQQTYTVETAWIIRNVGPAQLVTAYPAEKSKQRDNPAAQPPMVSEDLQGIEHWQAIYNLASQTAERAAASYVPTPMQVIGYETQLEGLSGGAYVRLDGRRAFARWAVNHGHATRSHGRGAHFPAHVDSQSVDRSKAYAKTFARVLWLNDVDGATVESYLT